MSKKLAQFVKVHAITNFISGDDICLVHVQNKKVIMRKGDVALGEIVVLIKENAIIPENTTWGSFLGKYRRVRPHSFRKMRSDCLALPVDLFPELNEFIPTLMQNPDSLIDLDLTKKLNLTMYKPKKVNLKIRPILANIKVTDWLNRHYHPTITYTR
jgi:hypothetical protein